MPFKKHCLLRCIVWIGCTYLSLPKVEDNHCFFQIPNVGLKFQFYKPLYYNFIADRGQSVNLMFDIVIHYYIHSVIYKAVDMQVKKII